MCYMHTICDHATMYISKNHTLCYDSANNTPKKKKRKTKMIYLNCVWIVYNRTDFYLLLDKLLQPNMAASSGLSGKMFFPATLEL